MATRCACVAMAYPSRWPSNRILCRPMNCASRKSPPSPRAVCIERNGNAFGGLGYGREGTMTGDSLRSDEHHAGASFCSSVAPGRRCVLAAVRAAGYPAPARAVTLSAGSRVTRNSPNFCRSLSIAIVGRRTAGRPRARPEPVGEGPMDSCIPWPHEGLTLSVRGSPGSRPAAPPVFGAAELVMLGWCCVQAEQICWVF